MKRVLSICLILTPLLTVPTLALATTDYKDNTRECCLPSLLDGLYIGAQIGYDSYRIRDKLNISAPIVAQTYQTLNATGPVGGIFVGIGKYFTELFYLGIEAFANESGADTRVNSTAELPPYANHFLNYRTKASWGVSLLPGIRIIDTALGYLRFGFNGAHLEATERATFDGFNYAQNNKHTGTAFTFGLGLETLIRDHWSLRTEYTHACYSSFRMRSRVTLNHPTDNQGILAAIYHF